MPSVLDRVDDALGGGMERLVVAHHRRRLRRLGHEAAMAPPDDGELWAAGEPPPRAGNRVDVLIDGAEAFPAMLAAIRGARRSVHLAGWALTPGFALTRDEPPVTVRAALADAAARAHVRVLLWAGSPLPVFHPDRREARRAAHAVDRPGIRVALDARERPMHCHHEKLLVVDDAIAFVGGIDVTTMGGDRWDTPRHPARGRLGWHDVATRIEGPVVADVARHLADRWEAVTGEALAVGAPEQRGAAGALDAQIVRTVPERRYPFAPEGDFRILEAYRRALRSAERLVYLENQFLWWPGITEILCEKLRHPPSPAFRAVVLLPGRPNNGAEDTRGQLCLLEHADEDGGGGRFLAATISARTGDVVDDLYVHVKVGIVDDRWMTIGSANLNAHSFFNDTEMNVVVRDPALVRDTRLRLWSEHLEAAPEELTADPATLIDERWRPIAAEQLRRVRAGEPRTHGLIRLPGTSRRTARLAGPLDGVLVDG